MIYKAISRCTGPLSDTNPSISLFSRKCRKYFCNFDRCVASSINNFKNIMHHLSVLTFPNRILTEPFNSKSSRSTSWESTFTHNRYYKVIYFTSNKYFLNLQIIKIGIKTTALLNIWCWSQFSIQPKKFATSRKSPLVASCLKNGNN